ncbi:periplasmic nitrate reductase, NapE protein [Catenovulum sp. 2E275]|uniref:periplasmic nitrate reductase, NapE protein n=1 Tax=Catenovulum sp. 2E275 TaxID=2980497 RepID=UPI0021CE1232|nr:periplasmic nitrate reductase, NapE protein [Catenovulum sp. 2E275]MCU4676701.1 periplasmic nitrate reductase, NapE protein [Catenovulum sp. 2E275]
MEKSNQASKKQELWMFLFITIVLFPVLSILLVSSYGFAIWISQLLFAPTHF